MADEQPPSTVSPSSSAHQPSFLVTPSLSPPSSSSSPTSTSSSWHGLSPSVNQPEAEQALDLAQQAFAAGRYYKAERLCLRSIRLYETQPGSELLSRIYDKIPHARPPATSSYSSSTSASTSTSSSPPSSATSSAPPPSGGVYGSSPSPSSVPSSSSASSFFSSLLPSASLPSWLTIPHKHRGPLLVIWALVLVVALLRFYGLIAAFDQAFATHSPQRQHPSTSTTHSTTNRVRRDGTGNSADMSGVGGVASVGGWLLGLTNLFPLVLMLLFASGQWQRWLQHQQQQRMQQH